MVNLNEISAPIDYDNPMNGLFQNIYKYIDVLSKKIAIVTHSTVCCDRKNAEELIKRHEGVS